jgi:phosphoglycolate phosphatase
MTAPDELSPSAVVFDLDGTLVDSRGDIVRACNAMLTSLARGTLPDETVAGFVGDGARSLVRRALEATSPSVGAAEVDRGLELFLDAYAADPIGRTQLMPGAWAALEALAPLPLALCTNKSRRTTLLVLEGLDLTRHFTVVVCGDDLEHGKPHPLPLRTVATRLGCRPERLVMVGDGPQDIECGRAAGARTIGVKGGVLPLERLLSARPDVLLDTLHELPAYIASLSG